MKCKVAAIQMTSRADIAQNQEAVARLVKEAANEGCKLAVLPECFLLFGGEAQKLSTAEQLSATPFFSTDEQPLLLWCASLARQHSIDLVLGGFWEASEMRGKVHNTSVYVARNGEVTASYRKIHLYDVDLADGTSLRESDTVAPGHEVVTADAPFGKLGLSVCYDVRFPELYRKLIDLGSIALSIPAAFTLTTGKDHWHVLLRARAIESQSYVIAAAQCGHHHGTRHTYGHALIVDPWGVVLAECGDGDGLAIAYVDPQVVARIRRQLPSLRHRVL